MYYRRKIILSLLQLCNGTIEKTRLQKLLFIYSKKKLNPEYEFVPYKFGCFSFSASADLYTMVNKGFLIESEFGYIKNDKVDYLSNLKMDDFKLLKNTIDHFGNLSNESLIKYTYLNFPYYSINSTIAGKILNNYELKKIQDNFPKDSEKCIFTIGYEGDSLENYLNRLIKNNIKLLIDVRKNPLSMKFGFSKNQLIRYCEGLKIKYKHIPEVGIESNKRRNLESDLDYELLFNDYKLTTLKETKNEQIEIINLLNKYNRIALTCFESNVSQCHRLHLTESLKLIRPEITVKHI